MRRILAATDLAERTRAAVGRAVQLCRELNAELTVVHVIDRELPAAVIEREQAAASELIRDQLARWGMTCGEAAGEARVVIATGKDWVDILRIADEETADLLVMGPHRDRGFRDLFQGTTIERVIRRGHRPVLMVTRPGEEPYRKAMVGMDFSVGSRRALEFGRLMAPQASLAVLHAYGIPFKGIMMGGIPASETQEAIAEPFESIIQEEMTAFLAGLDTPGRPIERILREGDVEGAIRTEAARRCVEVLMLGTHGRTGIARALLGSVTEGFLADPPCDVLTVKAW